MLNLQRFDCKLKHGVCSLDRLKVARDRSTAFRRWEFCNFFFEKVDQIIMPARLVIVFFVEFYFSHER